MGRFQKTGLNRNYIHQNAEIRVYWRTGLLLIADTVVVIPDISMPDCAVPRGAIGVKISGLFSVLLAIPAQTSKGHATA